MADLQKMAIAGFAPGKKIEGGATPEVYPPNQDAYDYTHVLHQSKGVQQLPDPENYHLRVVHEAHNNDRLEAQLFHNDQHVGSVVAYQRTPGAHFEPGDPRGIEPHAQLTRSYRGLGLGQAMYEAVMAHALHSGLGTHVIGGVHSHDAGAVHEKLSARHGMDYKPEEPDDDSSFDRGRYGYAIKSEGEMVKAEVLAKMAVVHDDAAKPATVYRLEGPNGESPYRGSYGNPEVGELLNAHGRGNNYVSTPAPVDDFDELDIRQHLTGAFSKPDHPYVDYKFAFERPEHATAWFGQDGLAGLAQHGYTLKPVQASRVIRSGSGKQVMYLPHQGVAKAEGEPAPRPQVALVVATDSHGRLLLGKRRDGSGWTLPGGHVEPKDGSVDEAALRELFEETGLKPTSLTLQRQAPGDGCDLWIYSAHVQGFPHGRNDPDQECEKWQFVDARGGLPKNIYDNLSGPEGPTNVVRQLYDLRRSEHDWLEDAGFADLRKADASPLLAHPDPRERAMSIKLDGTTPDDVATAVLDPDPWVWRSAFNHEHAAHALDVLAASHRDAAGLPLYDRHDALLKDPRCTAAHVRMMYRAAKDDHELPDHVRASRLVALEAHPLGQHADIPIGGKLAKNWAHDEIHLATSDKRPTRPFAEQPMPHLGHLVQAYRTHVAGSDPMFATDADLHHPGRASTKVVYKVPVAGHSEKRRLMVKPYAEWHSPHGGWAEGTSQALYHAAGIGHLHQQSFVATHGKGDKTVPALVIHIEDAVPASHYSQQQFISDAAADALPRGEQQASQARKVAAMDFLTNNFDRSRHNLMVKKGTGDLFAIDHGLAFKYPKDTQRFREFSEEAPATFGASDHNDYGDTFDWWRQNAPAIRKAFEDRTALVQDVNTEQEMRRGFDERAGHMDRWAAQHAAGQLQNDWAHSWPRDQVGG